MTGSEVVVNDVLIDPRNSRRVLLATDRGGVLASDNGAQTFLASNHGYTHRYVTSILADKNDPSTVFVGVLNDREWGGVFVSHDGGQSLDAETAKAWVAETCLPCNRRVTVPWWPAPIVEFLCSSAMPAFGGRRMP